MSESGAGSQVREDLAIIRHLMEDARETVANNGWHLVLWGGVLAAAEALGHWADTGVLPVSSSAVWGTAIGVGWAISIPLQRWRREQAEVDSLAERILAAIWVGCGLGLMLVGFCGSWTGTLAGSAALAAKAVPIGTAFFASSSFCHRVPFRVLAAAWWTVGGVMLIRPTLATGLVMSAGFLLLMAGPGLLLRRRSSGRTRIEIVS